MKTNTINSVLTGVLAVSLVLSMVFAFQFLNLNRNVRLLSGQVNSINVYRSGVQQLLNDCLQYSERNPALTPLLETIGVKQSKAAATPAKPAAR
jgi:hypothetical protein